MAAKKRLLFRPLLIVGLVVAAAVTIGPLLPADSSVKPPQGPPAEPVALPEAGEHHEELEAAGYVVKVKESPSTAGSRVVTLSDEYWQRSEAATHLIVDAQASHGDTFTAGFIHRIRPDGELEVIILATELIAIPGATVLEVPHSLKELERVRDWIMEQLSADGLTAEASASISRSEGLVVVSVCAPPDASLNLSYFPATAVDYTGECVFHPDPSNRL